MNELLGDEKFPKMDALENSGGNWQTGKRPSMWSTGRPGLRSLPEIAP